MKLAAIASLFDYLCEANAVAQNPTHGVKRPKIESAQGKTPPLADYEARDLRKAPKGQSLMSKRDRAILSVLLFQAVRREELCKLRIKDIYYLLGVKHLSVRGKGEKTRAVAISPATLEDLDVYLAEYQHTNDPDAPLFTASRSRNQVKSLTPDAVYKLVRRYANAAGIGARPRLGPHAMRSTAATNALENGADIKHVQEWLGHSKLQTTQTYDYRNTRPQDSPSFKVDY